MLLLLLSPSFLTRCQCEWNLHEPQFYRHARTNMSYLPGLYSPPWQVCCSMQAPLKVCSGLHRDATVPFIITMGSGKVLRLTL